MANLAMAVPAGVEEAGGELVDQGIKIAAEKEVAKDVENVVVKEAAGKTRSIS